MKSKLILVIFPALCALSMVLAGCDVEDLRDVVNDARNGNGCICTFSNGQRTVKQHFWPSDMQQRGVSSCGELQSSLIHELGPNASVSCKKAK